ncbi:hypothetical protein L6R52_33165 [Myxococcota bacterium]|nr:hypothetical protein [Myxococcota bacterium]
MVDPHALAERRSLALHRKIAERITREPRVVGDARARVETWMRDGRIAPAYARAWLALLDGPVDELCRVITDDGERARALRASTPFAGVIDARERWALWAEVKREAER